MGHSSKKKTIFIAGISSDIGAALARLWVKQGHNIIGTYRSKENILDLLENEDFSLIECDVSDPSQLCNIVSFYKDTDVRWDIFIGAIGNLAPIGDFFNLNILSWQQSIEINGQNQISLLHTLYPYRRAEELAKVAFLVGGAINRGFPNYSAYSLGKLLLVKFCELIHEECLDIHAVSIGTGWVATKIHNETILAAERAGGNYQKTLEFLSKSGSGTAIEDIKNCIEWCFNQERSVTGGRNFSVVNDPWKDGGVNLIKSLEKDSEKYKLRRYKNY